MGRCQVIFLPEGKTISVPSGSTVLDAAQRAGIFITNLCGGEGVCGECRIRLRSGRIKARRDMSAFLSPQEIDQGFVLACQAEIEEDIEVEIPPEARMEGQQILTAGAEEAGTSPGDQAAFALLKPLVRKIYLELPAPTSEDNLTDIERVSRELRRKIGWHSYGTSLSCLRELPHHLREHAWKVTASVVRDGDRYRIQQVEPGDTTSRNYGLAIDVGTTTVVAQLSDMQTGRVLGTEAAANLQASYGEDVISRLIYACDKGGLGRLHEAIIENINALIATLTASAGIPREAISALVAAGNTTMSHFFLGLTPCAIRLEPYVPTTDVYPQVSAPELGLQISPLGIVETLPSVASYVGGDIVAGVLACGMTAQPQVRGLIDIGTNGEIAIGNDEWLVCCSASAGPSFEGGGTHCGMRATRGAIQRVEIRAGQLHYDTIGQARPRGLCGSGLIDIIYELFQGGIIEPDGKFNRNVEDPRLIFEEEIPRYVIAWPDETETGEPIVFTEPDLDNLMKSKGSVFAAIKSLLDYIGLTFDQLDTFYVAGGFGNYLNIEKAVAIGLLPDIPRERIRFVGNSSLTGARTALLSEAAFERCLAIAKSMTNIELSTYQPYMDEYVAALFIPHTDRRLFPSVSP